MVFNGEEALPPSRLKGKMSEGTEECEEGVRAVWEEPGQGRNLMPPFVVIHSV